MPLLRFSTLLELLLSESLLIFRLRCLRALHQAYVDAVLLQAVYCYSSLPTRHQRTELQLRVRTQRNTVPVPVKYKFASFAPKGNPRCFFVMDMFFIRRGSRSLHRAQRRSLYSHARDRMHDFGCPSGSARARPLSSLSNHRPRDRHHRARTVALVPYHTRCSRRFRRSRLATPLDARTCAHVMHHTHTHALQRHSAQPQAGANDHHHVHALTSGHEAPPPSPHHALPHKASARMHAP